MRRLAAVLALAVATAPRAQELQPFVARSGTFQIDLPANWRQLAPGDARTIAGLPGAPHELGYVEPRLFYAIGPVDDWLRGRFDSPWLWVVEQDNEWVVDDDFASRLAQMWREKGDSIGTVHELAETGRANIGPGEHPVLTTLRTTTPKDGAATRSIDVYAPTGGRQVSLSLTCRADRFDRCQPEFRRWLLSLRFARPSQGQPSLSDRLWTPLLTGALVTVVLLLLYRHTRRQR